MQLLNVNDPATTDWLKEHKTGEQRGSTGEHDWPDYWMTEGKWREWTKAGVV